MPGILGLSVGTTNVVAALFHEGHSRIVRNQEGTSLTPSIVSRSPDGEWRAGQPAKRLAVLQPRDTAWDFVRLLGRRGSSPEVRSAAALAPFEVIPGPRGEAVIRLGGEAVHPVALVALLMAKLKAAAEDEANEPLDAVVIAHPAYFHTGHRRLLGQAAQLAGFRDHRFTAGTSVAALAMDHAPNGVSALCDLGGGSFGVALVELREGMVTVLAREADVYFAGEDIDQLLARRLLEEIYRHHGVDVSADPVVLAHVKESAERAKRWLSSLDEVEVDVPLGEKGAYSTTISRAALEGLVEPELRWLGAPVSKALKAAGMAPSDVQALFLLGGSTRIPLVISTLGRLVGKEPGVELHPQEAAAVGAAILGGIERGEVSDRLLIDIQSHDLGIEHPRGAFTRIVARGTSLPTKETRRVTTRESPLEVHLLEGSSPLAAECVSLGRLVWELPYQTEEAEVAVDIGIDDYGMPEVTVAQGSSHAPHRVPLRAPTDLNSAEMRRYGAEVERYRQRLRSDKAEHLSARGLDELSMSEKILVALNGDRKTRLSLSCDPARPVWSAVLESPMTTPSDVTAIVSLPDLPAEAFREIGLNPEWTKHYEIVRNLVQNPKAPPDVALKLVDRLKRIDLEQVLATDDLAPVLRDQCRALMKIRF